MVNFRDPAVGAQDAMAMIKLWHITSGVYIWEFFTTLKYEWNVIRGRRPYRWTIWIYSLARVATLLSVIFSFLPMDITGPINCQARTVFGVPLLLPHRLEMTDHELKAMYSAIVAIFFLAVSASSLLIVLRIIAIWNRNRVAVATAIGVWGINIAFLIEGTVRIRSSRAPAQTTCIPTNTTTSVLNLIAMLVTDITLLLIMLVGLFRLRREDGGTFGMSQFLWRQSVIWLLLATVAEVPPVVFVLLDLNDTFNPMFQPPSMIIIAIAATRIYRSLVDFASRTADMYDSSFRIPKTEHTGVISNPLDGVEVAGHAVVSRQHSTS